MASKSYIKRNLKSLVHKYENSTTLTEKSYFSKLAIIELCGWIEVSMDEMLEKHGKKLLSKNFSIYKEKLDQTYGFTKKRHLDPLIIHLIGLRGYERLMKSCDEIIMQKRSSDLGTLKTKRDDLAHAYIKAFTNTYDSPQKTLSTFHSIANGLDHLDDKLTDLRKHL